MSDRFQNLTKKTLRQKLPSLAIELPMVPHSIIIHLQEIARSLLTSCSPFPKMAPSDRPSNFSSPIHGQPDSPLMRSEYHMSLHPHQPFIRYEHRRRHPNSRIPSQGHVDRLPGVDTLLRRHNAMQTREVISPIRNPVNELEKCRSSDSTLECWTPPRLTENRAIPLSDSKWIPLTAALETTRSQPNFEPKIIEPVLDNQVEGNKTSSPVVRPPEPVRGPSESRPKSSRYLREIDRRRILMRIAQGEKQSALAKEYHVSRAAICNLNKHRAEVLSRNHEHPLAKHPKRRMLSKAKRQDTMDNQSSDSSSRSCE